MLKSKSSRRKQNQRATRTNLIGLGVVIIIIAVAYLFIQQFDVFEKSESPAQGTDGEQNGAYTPASSETEVTDIQIRITEATAADNEAEADVLLEALQRVMRTPADAEGLQLQQADVTGNGSEDWILMHGYREFSGPDEQTGGYERIIDGFEVIRAGKEDAFTSVLYVDETGMRGQGAASLVDQIPASHGYAFRTVSYDEPPYSSTALIFELAILDENNNLASDDLTLYWKPGNQVFAATNAFGQPGTFDD
jgi:hypothetical protein